MTKGLLEKYGELPLLFAGGVMSNRIIKNSFEEKYNAIFAPPQFSADNSAGIAYLGYRKYNDVHTRVEQTTSFKCFTTEFLYKVNY